VLARSDPRVRRRRQGVVLPPDTVAVVVQARGP
jgi:hypothetical protein